MQDYELLSKLGAGSFGIVHKARDKKTNTICVVKIVDISKMNAKLRKNAMEEGKILKEVNSPFIVKHFNTFIHKSNLNIVMEYCPKGDLTAYMKAQMGKPLKQDNIWKFSIQMLGGLRDLHAKKILHRDIKSLNVFLDDNYNAKIGDLGVAKTMTTEFAHTIVGTPYYLSPQMCEQKPYNEKTDIWAMGCVIYELCTGRRPFEANNQAALALKIVMGKYDSLPPHLSSDLAWVVKSCLSVDYKRRPTAAYLLGMPKTKEWATKLNILLDPQQYRTNKIENKDVPKEKQEKKLVEQPKIMKKQSEVQKLKKQTSNQSDKNNKQKQTEAEKRKISKDGEKNVQQVLNNKVSYSSKPVQYSGAKKLEIISKEKKESEKEKIILKEPEKKCEIEKQKEKIQLPKDKEKQKQQDKLKYLKKHTQKMKEKPQKKVVEREYISQPSFAKEKDHEVEKNRKEKLMSTTVNRFLPESYRKKKQIDLEDESKIEQLQLLDSDSSEEQQKQKKSTPKKDQVFHMAQQAVDDDELMKQFGLAKHIESESAKKSVKVQNSEVSNFKLDKKPISINWNSELQAPSDKDKLKNKSSLLDEIPTVKTKSTLELQVLPEMSITDDVDHSDNIDEQINENRPYISDEEDQENESQSDQEQFLIEDIEQKQQDLFQKLKENQKRKQELERMKQHFEPELIKMMSKPEYERLKMKIIDCREDEVEGFVQGWKGNLEGMNLFYRIIHFDMEIRRCEANLKQIEDKLDQIKKQKS